MENTATITSVPQRPDGAVLHFLKELPAWCVIGVFVAGFLTVWQISHDDFIPRILDGLIGALLTAIISNRPKQPTLTGKVETTEEHKTDKEHSI